MTSPRKKRLHSLHLARDGAEFARRFEEETGESVTALVTRYIDSSRVTATVLGGSIPLGSGSPVSDIDLIVIVDSTEVGCDLCLAAPGSGLDVLFSGPFVADHGRLVVGEIILLAAGLEIDLQFILAERLAQLASQLVRASVSLTHQEIAILSRLKTGWVLSKSDRLEATTAGFLSENALEIYCAVRWFVFAQQDLEDARAALAGDLPVVFHMGRLSVEKAFAAWFASRGYAFLGAKWLRFLRVYLGSRRRDSERLQHLAARGVHLLFPSLSDDPGEARRYVDEVASFVTSTRRSIEADATFAVAFKLARQIHEVGAA